MATIVELDNVSLKFPKTDYSEVLTEDTISTQLDTLSSVQTNFPTIIDSLEIAKSNTTSDQLFIDGVEELSGIINRNLLEVAKKIQTEKIPDTYNQLVTLQQEQKKKEQAIVDAYFLAQEAKTALEEQVAAQSKYDHWYSLVSANNAPTEETKQYRIGALSDASDRLLEKKKAYILAKEKALTAYRAAKAKKPNGADDYDMSEV